MKLLLIINPCSGTKQAKKYVCDIVSLFMEYGFLCTVFITTKHGDATDVVIKYGKEFELIVCVGGDGTFNEVVCGIIHADLHAAIGYIPAGSTNDFANTMRLSSDIITAATDIMTGYSVPLDVGLFNNRAFSYVASFGAFTKASYSTSQTAKNTLGRIAYILSGIIDIASIEPLHVTFSCDAMNVEDDYVFGAICNSTSVGGLISLDKDVVDMNDGLFEVILIKSPKNAIQLQEIITALTTNRPEDCAMIDFCHTGSAHIIAEPGMDWTLDGEYEKGFSEITIENLHSAISLIAKVNKN